MKGGEVPVGSSRVAAVRYSAEGRVLQVRFRDGYVCRYRGVPREKYEGLVGSKSAEKYLRASIEPFHGVAEVDRPGIREVRIQNFRSIKDLTVRFGDLTVLIGANGTGKTAILDALDVFMSKSPAVGDGDYYRRSGRIDITVDVNPGGHPVDKRFLRNGAVRLRRTFTRDRKEDGRALMAETRHHADFGFIRERIGAAELRKRAKRVLADHPGAPPYTKKAEYQAALAEYERELSEDPGHADKFSAAFVRYDPAQEGDAHDDLMRMVSWIHVPAARDIAADGRDGARSPLGELLGMTVRDERGDAALRGVSQRLEEAHGEYSRAVAGKIRRLGRELGRRARTYMDGARFRIELDGPEEITAHPGASVRMRDNGFMSRAGLAGSGFQRVYLLSLLDMIAARRRAGARGAAGAAPPARLIIIDEPELYQHPQRQRRILKNFVKVAEADRSVRIVCSTHSPYFVELRRVDTLRLLQKQRRGEAQSVTLGELEVPMLGEKRAMGPGSREALSTWLDMNATHWITEGFFSRTVAMVEGPGDRNMLLATASAMGVDLDACEISVAPVGGSGSLEKFMQLFAGFRIPAYPIWDLDQRHRGGAPAIQKRNRELVRLACGIEQKRSPSDTIVDAAFACFEDNLTTAMAEDLLGCEDVLGGNETYRGLKRAVAQDRKDTRGRRQKRGRAAPPAQGAAKKDVIAAQKSFLNSKLNVFLMLEAVRGKSPERLEGFAAVRVVRMLERSCKGGRRRTGKPARPAPWGAGGGGGGVTVNSTRLSRVGYDPDSRTLRIWFHSGGLYEYYGVPAEVHGGLMGAPSHSKYFHQNIEDKYGYKKAD